MRLLVSVRSIAEARLARDGGADFIDLKEPRDGALGGLPAPTISAIVEALDDDARAHGTARLPISATIGDLPVQAVAAIVERAHKVAGCGVDLVKVGVDARDVQDAGAGVDAARRLLDALARSGLRLMPVFIADDGLDARLLAHAAALGFAGVMADTADKRGGSLLDRLAPADLRRFVDAARAAGMGLIGLAGALRAADLPAVEALGPDFAGFRSAVCAGERADDLSLQRLRALVAARDACGADAIAPRPLVAA